MREYPLAVGAGYDVVRRNRLLGEVQSLSFHDQVGAAVRSVIAQRHQALRRVNVDAVPITREMRPACSARGQNQVGLSSLRGNPNEVGVLRRSAVEGAVFPVIRVAAEQHDFCAVRRPGRIAVHRQGFRQRHRSSTGRRDFPQLPAVARPGHVNDGLAIR